MLQGIIKVLFYYIGYGLVYLGYGKEAMEARKEREKSNMGLSLLFAMGLVAWVICLIILVSGAAAKDTGLCIGVVIAVPALYVLWVIYARKTAPSYIEELNQASKQASYLKEQLDRQKQER